MTGSPTLTRPGRTHERPISTYLLVATIVISATCGLFSLALNSAQNRELGLAGCAAIAADAARLACYDQRDHTAVIDPAKGATAPALAR